MEEVSLSVNRRLTTFLEEKRVVLICFFIAFGQFQYGYDSQSMAIRMYFLLLQSLNEISQASFAANSLTFGAT
jgi:hypothetical protein